MKKKVGITGQAGFIGTHLFNNLGQHDDFERVPFADEYFQDDQVMDRFVQKCDVIVHLAALNRHNDPDVIYKTNLELVDKLIASVKRCGTHPHIIMSSSTQE
ncbi:MAG: NAD-dependent epimerase/dehydratase family protein, partial [Candidatus Zophobacter franzmannii]|nr:NAD-dependent epimerase/dehydratase family protein [Candidatus Zophobacter franzmannii]